MKKKTKRSPVSEAAAVLGKLGARVTNAAPPEVRRARARHAVNVRWARYRERQRGK